MGRGNLGEILGAGRGIWEGFWVREEGFGIREEGIWEGIWDMGIGNLGYGNLGGNLRYGKRDFEIWE